MRKAIVECLGRHGRLLLSGTFALLVIIAAAEGYFLYRQREASQAIEVQSAKLLTRFLKGDTTAAPGGGGVAIRLQNVRFKWSDRVYIDAGDMALRAVPLHGSTVMFDDLESFRLALQKSVITISPAVLEGMFNESIFNYPHSKVRDLKVALARDHEENLVRLSGSVNAVLWVPFTMFTRLSVDTRTNTLVIDVDHLKLFGVIPATKLIKWKPLNLESLISLPPNQSLIVAGNRMMVKPFGLFPPPRVDGRMSSVSVDGNVIRLAFAGESVEGPKSTAKNYVYLRGGTSQFGNIRMMETDVLVFDRDPADPFGFSLVHYNELLPRSEFDVRDTKFVRVAMPDV